MTSTASAICQPGIIDQRSSFAQRLVDLAAEFPPAIGTDIRALLDVRDAPPQPAYGKADRTDTPTLVVPGLLGDTLACLVAPLMLARQNLECRGYDIDVAWVNGRAGCDRNAARLRDQVLATADRRGQAVHVIGYSKGCCDALHMLANHPETHAAISSLVSLAGPVSGTPLADQTPDWVVPLLRYTPVPGARFGDGQAVANLTTRFRRQWLEEHPLPTQLRYATVVAAPQAQRVSRILRRSHRQLSTISPSNDSQVIDRDCLLPNGDLLAIVNADHWAVALPVATRLKWISRWLIDQNAFPRTLLLQAIIDHLNALRLSQASLDQRSGQTITS